MIESSDPVQSSPISKHFSLHGKYQPVPFADFWNRSSRRPSPAGNPPPLQNPRKRRREEKRRQQANKRVVRSPEPYIKEEPQSPPPFAHYPDAQPSKRRALQPLPSDSEQESARGSRIQPVHYREQEHSPRSYRPFEEPTSPTVIHVPQRRVERDDQDLRRVASLQHARRPYSPGPVEQYYPIETHQVRAASHAFVDRPVERVHGDASIRPSADPRHLRERSRSPIQEYLPRPHSPIMMMAPPARRIVQDQFGNKYYAAPVDVRESVAPLRRIEADAYYERAVTREPALRGGARTEVYEDNTVLRMPPPPTRRYVEVADGDIVDAQAYRQREASRRPMEAEYSGRSVVERRPVQYEEMGPPREYMPSRAYSLRPETVRRELADEYVPMRQESVVPRQPRYISVAPPAGYREASVAHGEAHDDGRYAMATPIQSRRYVDDGGDARRVSYRY
jgi:hypothetical protein